MSNLDLDFKKQAIPKLRLDRAQRLLLAHSLKLMAQSFVSISAAANPAMLAKTTHYSYN